MRRFFDELSPASRRIGFQGAGQPPDSVIDRLISGVGTDDSLTLIAVRWRDGAVRIIAVGAYFHLPEAPASAEVAFAVADSFHGKGLATALLERLASAAGKRGVRRFVATTLAENGPMLDVFRDSGFHIRSKSDGGCIEVELSIADGTGSAGAEERRHQTATAASLRPLLEPRAIAVVGASRAPASIGRRVLDAVIAGGFSGPIYPVNPHAGEIAGLPACRSARELPPGVDLAIVTVPAAAVLGVVDDCAAAGVRSLVVITAGFAEAGTEGRMLQQRLTHRVRDYGMRMVGPNCMGVMNASPAVSLNASFSPLTAAGGHVGLMSQSGALGLAILALAAERRIGLSTFVSAGNKADVSGNDLLEYWAEDPRTHVILLYLESFGNPRRFARLARTIGRRKPIVAVKSGRTRAGTRAASSHTAALAASDTAVDALFHQAGVIRADTIDEMFDISALLDCQPLPAGRRVAIVTNAGGPGILAADACEAAGLTVAPFSEATRDRLAAALPPMASCGNPVDMVASAGANAYRQTIETVMAASEIDAVLVIFTAVDASSTDAVMASIRDGVFAGRTYAPGKPILACIMAKPGSPVPIDIAGECLPTYAFPENAIRALGKVAAHAEWRRQPAPLFWTFDDVDAAATRTICQAAVVAAGEAWLGTDDVRRVLSAYGLPLIAGSVARTADEAAAFAETIGFPVAAKLSAVSIQHKTDIGGVRLNLADAAAVRVAFTEIVDAARQVAAETAIDGVLIQPMLAGGVETMIGISHDPLFGPLIAFGLGGIHVEILGDVQFRIAPLTDHDVDELLHGIKGFRLLQGYRGHPAGDVEALRELLLRLSCLAEDVPEIAEVDLNPVIALPPGHGARVVDARVKVRRL
jgi:acetyl coenzyme A synthetase (ADP forming)-like protein